MKLYLSSYHLSETPKDFSDLFSEGRKVAIITNALDFSDDDHRLLESYQREMTDLAQIHLEPQQLI